MWSHLWVTAQIYFLTHNVVHVREYFNVIAKSVAGSRSYFQSVGWGFAKTWLCGTDIKSSRLWGNAQEGKIEVLHLSLCLCGYTTTGGQQLAWLSDPFVYLCSPGLSFTFSYHSYRAVVLAKWCLNSTWVLCWSREPMKHTPDTVQPTAALEERRNTLRKWQKLPFFSVLPNPSLCQVCPGYLLLPLFPLTPLYPETGLPLTEPFSPW